jgi:hypothetical protein
MQGPNTNGSPSAYTGFLHIFLFYHEDRSDMFFRNIGRSPKYTALLARIPNKKGFPPASTGFLHMFLFYHEDGSGMSL